MTEVATLGGGCFWCLEAVFQELVGVVSVQSGYAGGHVADPSYEAVCTGNTGHAEVVQVAFDPQQLSYRDLLEVFFAIHDPTTPDRQGNDIGPQYRSVIFHHSDEQRRTAEEVMGALPVSPVVTQLEPATRFYPAEKYHDNYYRDNPHQPYCLFAVAPKLHKFRKQFASKRRQAVE